MSGKLFGLFSVFRRRGRLRHQIQDTLCPQVFQPSCERQISIPSNVIWSWVRIGSVGCWSSYRALMTNANPVMIDMMGRLFQDLFFDELIAYSLGIGSVQIFRKSRPLLSFRSYPCALGSSHVWGWRTKALANEDVQIRARAETVGGSEYHVFSFWGWIVSEIRRLRS